MLPGEEDQQDRRFMKQVDRKSVATNPGERTGPVWNGAERETSFSSRIDKTTETDSEQQNAEPW